MQKEPKYSWNVVILSGNKQKEDVETRQDAEDSRFQWILWTVNLWTDVMLFVGKLHSARLFQIDSELVLSNATLATQGWNSGTRRRKRKEEESWRRCEGCCGVEKEKGRVWGGKEDMGWWKGRVEDEDQGCGRILSIGLIKNLRLQSLGVQELMITKWKTPASNTSVNVRPGLLTCPNSYRPSRGSLPSCARKSRRERSKGNQSGFKNSYSPTHRQGF